MAGKDRPDFHFMEIDMAQDRNVLPDFGEILCAVRGLAVKLSRSFFSDPVIKSSPS